MCPVGGVITNDRVKTFNQKVFLPHLPELIVDYLDCVLHSLVHKPLLNLFMFDFIHSLS